MRAPHGRVLRVVRSDVILTHGASEAFKIAEMPGADCVHDGPVDGAVVVHGDVAETNGIFEPKRQICRDASRIGQLIECLSHGVGYG